MRLGCRVAARAVGERGQLADDVRRFTGAARMSAFQVPVAAPGDHMRTAVVDAPHLGSLMIALRHSLGDGHSLDALRGKPNAPCASALHDYETLYDDAAATRKIRVIVAYGRAQSEAEREKGKGPRPVKNRAFLRPVVCSVVEIGRDES